MTYPTTSVNPLLVELICRQIVGGPLPDQDVCTVTADPDDASVWVRLVEPTATMDASAGLASYGLLVTVTGADTIHVSGWSSRLLPGRRQRAKQWIARLATPRARPTYRVADSVAGTPVGVRNEDSARADGHVGFPPVGYPPVGFPPMNRPLRNRPAHEPNAPDSASLIYAIDAAAEVYQRLLDERIEFAEYMLTIYLTALQSQYADVANSSSARPVERATDDRQPAAFEATSGARAVA